MEARSHPGDKKFSVVEGEAKSGNEEVGRGSGEVETKENKKSFQLEKNIFHLFDPWAQIVDCDRMRIVRRACKLR